MMKPIQVDYPRDKCIHQLFEEQVARTPAEVALICDERRVSFSDLNRRANQLARHLRTLGAGPDVPVALCMERSVEMIEGLLGILKAGGAYTPLDPASPPERKQSILEDAQAPILLTQSRLDDRLPPQSARRVYLDTASGVIAAEGEANLNLPACKPERLAYVLYTSGSTGKPKGVMGLHRGAVNRLFWMWRQYPYAPHEVACLKTPLVFIDSLCEIFGPMLRGIPLALVPEGTSDLRHLVWTLSAHHVSRLVLVPSLLRALLEAYPDIGQRLPHLRQCVSSGETLPLALAREFRRRMPYCTLLNLYGSTEVSADATWYSFDDECPHATVPIGRPIANASVFILDSNGQPVPAGACGEIYVGGEGLARGYLNCPELTAERFVLLSSGDISRERLFRTGDLGRFLPDGNIEFLGRLDQQLKIRGCRVEPGEIENALGQHDAVGDVAVVGHDDGAGGKRLVAYVVPRAPGPVRAEALASWLRHKLPDYMIPASFISLERLPLNSSGKVDRQALLRLESPPAIRVSTGDASLTHLEKLNRIWCQTLQREAVSIHESFFAMGGNSLSALNMILEVEQAFGVTVPQDFFASPTIETLARLLSNHSAVPADADTVYAPPATVASSGSRSRVRLRQTRLRRLRRLPETFAFKLPFPSGIDWLREWFGDPAVIGLLCRKEKALVRRFVADLADPDSPFPPLAEREDDRLAMVLRNALVMDALHRRLDRVVRSLSGHREFGAALASFRSPFWKPFSRITATVGNAQSIISQQYALVGMDSLAAARAQGRGVILLTYHTPLGDLLMPLLEHWGFPQASIAAWQRWFVHPTSGNTRRSDEECADHGTRLALETHILLAQGGLVVIAGDGRRGQVHSHLPICGRIYPLRAGFAELAVRTRAAVLPTTVTLDADRRIRVVLHAELDRGREGTAHSERVLHLLRQYATFLETSWRESPENLTLRRMKLHLMLPLAVSQA